MSFQRIPPLFTTLAHQVAYAMRLERYCLFLHGLHRQQLACDTWSQLTHRGVHEDDVVNTYHGRTASDGGSEHEVEDHGIRSHNLELKRSEVITRYHVDWPHAAVKVEVGVASSILQGPVSDPTIREVRREGLLGAALLDLRGVLHHLEGSVEDLLADHHVVATGSRSAHIVELLVSVQSSVASLLSQLQDLPTLSSMR